MYGGVGPTAQHEAMRHTSGVDVIPDNHTRIVNIFRPGSTMVRAVVSVRDIYGGISSATQDKAVIRITYISMVAHNCARIINAGGSGIFGAGIVGKSSVSAIAHGVAMIAATCVDVPSDNDRTCIVNAGDPVF